MKNSLFEKLKEYEKADVLPMHMPGHKRRTDKFSWLNELSCGLDITEIDGFDNLNDPESFFAELNDRAAHLWGADRSFCLVNGSTGGILAAVKTALSAGGDMLISRGCHKSVYNAAELCGADVHYILPPTDEKPAFLGAIPPGSVSEGLDKHPNTRIVVITSPTYEGVISDISAISRVCHEKGAVLLVDAAHGAHLGFGAFPESPVREGADMAVMSLHKTLPSLTQTALLHVSGELVDKNEAARNVALFQSSSPSYLLSASIDGCVRFMEERGDASANELVSALKAFYKETGGLEKLSVFRMKERGYGAFDPSKIIVFAKNAYISGAKLAEMLRNRKIEPEMAAVNYVLLMTGLGDDEKTLKRLSDALFDMDKCIKTDSCEPVFPAVQALPEKKMPLCKALKAASAPWELTCAVGRISAEFIWAYPPGAPLLVPGELVEEDVAKQIDDLIKKGVSVRSTRGKLPKELFCVEKCY